VRVIHSLTDVFQHTLNICHDLVVPIAQNTETFGFQILRSLPIRLPLVRMLPSVEFYNEEPRRAAEIHNVGTDRMLPSELETTELSGSETLPQKTFDIRLISSQRPCEITLGQASCCTCLSPAPLPSP
jgi:hypothetical protein